LVEEKPHVEEIRVPTIEIVPPIEIPEVEIAAHPPVPEIDLESAISVAKDIIKENKELALYIIKKWLSER
jgi:hypothetical protein